MPRGGKRAGAGKKPGSKNRRTREREKAAQLEKERLALLERAVATGSLADRAEAQGAKLMKDIGMDLTRLTAGLAAFYQPFPTWHKGRNGELVNDNPHYDEARFRYYMQASIMGAQAFAAYESPKLSAVMVGQQIVTQIKVEGGMPDEFAPPVAGPAEFQPGDIVSAEDGSVEKRVVNGDIVQLPVPVKAAG